MGLGPFIVIIKELKAHVFNAKGKREIPYEYWRSLPSNLLGQSQWGFHECFIHIKYNATSAKFHFLHETLRREKERVSPW
jgi:hypothetical protein